MSSLKSIDEEKGEGLAQTKVGSEYTVPSTISEGSEEEIAVIEKEEGLSPRKKWNLACLVMAFACVVVNTVLILGGSGLAILSVGGATELTTSCMASFYAGSATISLFTTWLFARFGRKMGFVIGYAIGMTGSALGIVAIMIRSPLLLVIAAAPLGATSGIGYYLRFYTLEVVSEKALHMGIALSGGLLAAFVGPEVQLLTVDLFPDYPYLGIYLFSGIFFFIGAVALCAIRPPPVPDHRMQRQHSIFAVSKKMEAISGDEEEPIEPLYRLVFCRKFLVPAVVSMLLFVIIAMPTSLIVVAMDLVGFTSRQQILSVELSFAGQWGPGLLTGLLIDSHGIGSGFIVCLVLTLTGTIMLALSSESDEDHPGNVATWLIGSFLLCVGWVFGYSSVTILSTRNYQDAVSKKNNRSRLQAANDFVTFLGAAVLTYVTGYIYEAGGGGMDGWKLVNYITIGVITLMSGILCVDAYLETKFPAGMEESQTAGEAPVICYKRGFSLLEGSSKSTGSSCSC